VSALQAIGVEVRARDKVLIRDISLEVKPGEFLAVIGPNGAGKSTLLSALAGDRQLAAGQVLLADRPIAHWKKADLAHRRAVLPQHSTVAFDFTGLQIASLGLLAHRGRLSDRQIGALAEQALAETEALAFADRPYAVLSGGERQRVQLARVLAQCDADSGRLRASTSPTSMPPWPAPGDGSTVAWASWPSSTTSTWRRATPTGSPSSRMAG
jgi:iron complex transport system ATP-binding protein